MKRPIVLAVAAILSMGMLSCGKKEEETTGTVVRPVKMMEVGSAQTGSVRSYPGTVNASQQVDLAFQVAGPIVELPVNEGDSVEEGQVVAQIRKEDFVNELNSAQSRLETSKSQLQAMESGARPEDIARLESQLSAAQAKFKTADVDFKRNTELLREGVIPQSRFDISQAAFEVAKSQLESAHKELEIGMVGARPEDIAAKKAEVQSIEATVEQAEIDLADTTLKAPFSGRIARKYVDNFQNVQGKEPILSLQDISSVEIVVNLPETHVITVKRESIGQIVAEFDAVTERKFDLEIKEFSTEADSQTQTYKATLVMPAPKDVNILPGMTAKVSIDFGTKTVGGESGFKVPLAAILNENQDKNFVWKVDPQTMEVTKVPVELGTMTGNDIMITKGVETGSLIATAGVHHLREGMKVKRLNPTDQSEGDKD